jgi:O-antigen/teichoic acid export membrane protein
MRVEGRDAGLIVGVGVNEAGGAARFESLRRLLAPLKSENLLSHNLIVGAGTMLAGVLGVAFQSLVSHQLRPAEYGAVFAVITLITFIGLPASAFTLLMAREASRDRADRQYMRSTALLQGGNRTLMLVGIACATAFALASPLMARFLDLPVPLLLAAAAGIPFGLALPLLLGEFQGEQRFLAFSLLATGQAGLKLIGALVLGIVYGPLGIVAGISLGSAVLYLVAARMLQRKLSITAKVPWVRPAAVYLALIVPSTLALAVLLSADVLIVKHFFPSRQAGEYAAVAAMGRAIFWGATGVVGVLFPKIVVRESQGRSGILLISASLGLVALGGLGGLAVLSFSSTWLLSAFAGGAYAQAAAYVPWYALGMTLLGGAAVLIATQQSRGKPAFLAVLLPLTILESVLLVAFHQSVMQVVQVLDIAMALLLVGLGAQVVLQHHTADRVLVTSNPAFPATAPSHARVEVSQ